MLEQGGATLVGEINDLQKPDFLSGAIALLMPIDWPEPFGLVMVEAMACGVPVIAFNRGSVPEIIEDGITGLIVENERDAVAAVRHARAMDRTRIRRRFEERFTARRMAEDYLGVYKELAKARRAKLRLVS
jgi:glycosyltransferase involved in cell wall biosynthesis